VRYLLKDYYGLPLRTEMKPAPATVPPS